MTRLVISLVFFTLLASGASAQSLELDLGNGGSLTATVLQLFAALTILSLAPGIVITITCFPFIVTVLAILRQAIGLQQSPPNMLMVSLALFLTFFVMEPVLIQSWEQGIVPLLNEEIDHEEGFLRGFEPFRVFMAANIDPQTFNILANIRPELELVEPGPQTPTSILIRPFCCPRSHVHFRLGFCCFYRFS